MRIEMHDTEFKEALNLKLIKCLEESGQVVQDEAKNNCPVKTGALMDSIEASVDTSELKAIVGSELEYALIIELGSRKQAPQPYLRQALSSKITQIEQIFNTK